jgi:hypothetical protein
MVRSRDLPSSRRAVLQGEFSALMAELNRNYRETIASKFVITLGDEFQGLLNSAVPIPDLIWHLEQSFPKREFRVGIGLGALDTPIQKYAINIDGPALHTARSAIDQAKKSRSLGGAFRGFGELDDILTGMGSLLRQGMSQTQAAKKLRIAKQVVSRQALSAGWFQYRAAENAWRMILQKQVDPLLSSKHASSQRH